MAKTKYRKKPVVTVDLRDRKNMQIIPDAEHICSTDEDIRNFEDRLESRYSAIREFSDFCIQNNTSLIKESMSDDIFNETMSNMLKRHKVLKSMLKEANE